MSEERDVLILIGGSSGAGKTSVAEAIEKRGIAVYKKIHEFMVDIAQEKGEDVQAAIEQLDDSVVIERMIALVKERHSVVSDLHFAIQPKADTLHLVGRKNADETFELEEYEPAFMVSELKLMTDRGVTLVPLLITRDVESSVKGMEKRWGATGQIPRSSKSEIVRQEGAAELKIYLSIVGQLDLQPRIFVNIDNQFSKLMEEIVALLEAGVKK